MNEQGMLIISIPSFESLFSLFTPCTFPSLPFVQISSLRPNRKKKEHSESEYPLQVHHHESTSSSIEMCVMSVGRERQREKGESMFLSGIQMMIIVITTRFFFLLHFNHCSRTLTFHDVAMEESWGEGKIKRKGMKQVPLTFSSA